MFLEKTLAIVKEYLYFYFIIFLTSYVEEKINPVLLIRVDKNIMHNFG